MKYANFSDVVHVPRMALQLALTTLESVAVMLNERKRESEQSAAFHAKLRNSGSKLAKSEAQRVLLREDDVQQLEFNSLGQVCRSKPRRLLLLNDQVRNWKGNVENSIYQLSGCVRRSVRAGERGGGGGPEHRHWHRGEAQRQVGSRGGGGGV